MKILTNPILSVDPSVPPIPWQQCIMWCFFSAFSKPHTQDLNWVVVTLENNQDFFLLCCWI